MKQFFISLLLVVSFDFIGFAGCDGPYWYSSCCGNTTIILSSGDSMLVTFAIGDDCPEFTQTEWYFNDVPIPGTIQFGGNTSYAVKKEGMYKVKYATGSYNGWDSIKVIIKTVGMEKVQQATSFLIFPNPARSLIIVEYELDKAEMISIEMKDAFGQTVKTVEHNVRYAGRNKKEVDISELASGIYMIQVHYSDKTIVKRFVKQ